MRIIAFYIVIHCMIRLFSKRLAYVLNARRRLFDGVRRQERSRRFSFLFRTADKRDKTVRVNYIIKATSGRARSTRLSVSDSEGHSESLP